MSDQHVPEEIHDNRAVSQKQERLAAWLQFPRRVVFLLMAFGWALALLGALKTLSPAVSRSGLNWDSSWATKQPVAQIVGQRLPNTLLLLGAAIVLAFLLALFATLAAALVHKLEQTAGPLGSILKGLGRLALFSPAVTPVFVLALVLLAVFAIRLKLLPLSGMYTLNKQSDVLDLIRHIILPVTSLALLPALLTAQAVVREVTLPRERGGLRLWLAGLLKMWGMLLGQIGGWLTAALVVETVFAWPGAGLLALVSITRGDYPMVLGVLNSFAILILVGRLLAELFRWLERLVLAPIPSVQVETTRWRKTARIIWVVLALVLLLAPLALAVAGLTMSQDAVTRVDSRNRNAPPSAQHPWGTDTLGRDVRARVLRGTAVAFGIAALAALVVFIPGLLGGMLTGWLASRRAWWSESLADLLLLPADALLFIPAVGVAAISIMLQRRPQDSPLMLAAMVVLLPRVVRMYHALWVAAPAKSKGLVVGVAGSGILLLGGLLAGFGFVLITSFLGIGILPPTPSLGGDLREMFTMFIRRPELIVAPAIVAWACCLALYTATDALVGFFSSKEPLARLNE